MGSLQVQARLTIHEGKLAEFKEAATQCLRAVREKDTGTLQYDWFLNQKETVCVVKEAYRDSAALLEHFGNTGDVVGPLLAVCDMELEVYGEPSEELAAAVSGFSPAVYGRFQGM